MQGAALAGEHQTPPEVSLHTHPFSEYMRHIEADDWQAVAELMLSSAEKLARSGAEFLVAPCNTIHHAFELARRFHPAVTSLGAFREPTLEDYDSLAGLLGARGVIALLLEAPPQPRADWTIVDAAPVLQMVHAGGKCLPLRLALAS